MRRNRGLFFRHSTVGGARSCALAVLLLATLACANTQAAPLLLVTEAEAALEAATPAPVRAKTRAFVSSDLPKIKVISPASVKDVLIAPIPIELKFSSAGDAEIDPSTFRASYGFLQVDVTSRITQSIKVTKTGFTVAEAAIPKGSHRLVLQVSDTKGRTGESELKFTVE